MQTKEVPSKKALRWTLLGLAFSAVCLFFSDRFAKQPFQEPTALSSKALKDPLKKELTESRKTNFPEAPSEFFWTVPNLEKEIQVAYTPKKPGKKEGIWRVFFLRTQKSHPIKIHQNIQFVFPNLVFNCGGRVIEPVEFGGINENVFPTRSEHWLCFFIETDLDQ